jgi:hypothetical protein
LSEVLNMSSRKRPQKDVEEAALAQVTFAKKVNEARVDIMRLSPSWNLSTSWDNFNARKYRRG